MLNEWQARVLVAQGKEDVENCNVYYVVML